MEFVRPAADDDIAVLAALEDEARSAVAAQERGGDAWLVSHPRLATAGWTVRLADPGWAVVVAGIDGVVLGAGCLRLPVGRRRPVAEVEGIYVTPGARDLGLGELLLGALIERARSAGADSLDASALPGDRETKNLYERSGLVARLIVVSRDLRT